MPVAEGGEGGGGGAFPARRDRSDDYRNGAYIALRWRI